MGDIADCGEECRVDHCGAGAEYCCAEGPRPEAVHGRHPSDGGGLGEHAGHDQRLAANPIRERSGVELAESPDTGVDRCQDADATHGEAGCGEEDREQTPCKTVVEIVDEACL